MSRSSSARDRTQKIVVILLFIILVLSSIIIKMYHRVRTLEETQSETAATVETIVEPPITSVGKIAIIIDDFGYRNDSVSDGFLDLDVKLTFAVIPGHKHSQTMSRLSKENGFEVIVHMPMESNFPSFGEDEYVIKSSMTSTEVEERIEKVLIHLPEAVGMNNHQGSKTTVDSRTMNVIGTVLKNHGKYYLDSRTTPATKAEAVMRSLGVPTGHRHVFLDNDDDETLIVSQVEKLKQQARENGMAVAIGHVRKNTLNVLRREIPKMIDGHFEFVFISNVVN